MIKHQSFFEFLSHADQEAPVWQPVLIGLAVLRMIDSRIAHDCAGDTDWASVESIKSAVNAISDGNPVRAILLQLTAAVSGTEIQRGTVGRCLIAYGRALDFVGQWTLAGDVFATADAIAGEPADARISIESNIALGAASRLMGDWDTSEHAYARAAYVADTIGDTAALFQVEVGRANTQMLRGNLSVAESMLDEVIGQTRASGANDVLGRALLSRASVAHLRGAYADAVRIGYEALETTTNPTARDTILSDIAAAFAGLGLREPARDSYLIVAGTAQSQWVRWQATLNLMELAGLEGREADFDAYAREMKAGAITELARHGIGDVLLQRFEDSPQVFRATVERARGNPLKRKIMDALRPQVSQLPLLLGPIVEEIFEFPHRYASAQEIAVRADMSTVRLYRHFGLAGLGSPKRVLRVAKLLQAYSYLRDRGYSVRDVAKKVGYKNPRLFGEHAIDVFGLTPSRIRSHVTPDEAMKRLLAWLAVADVETRDTKQTIAD